MLVGKNSQSAIIEHSAQTPPESEKTLKIYTCELDSDRTKNFRETLKSFLTSVDECDKLKEAYHVAVKAMALKAKEHEVICTELHDHLCKKLAICGYNEFKNKVHVDANGKVFIIDKDVIVKAEDL